MVRNQHGVIGDEGFGICLVCGTRFFYQMVWDMWVETDCPRCGAVMVREGSPYPRYAARRGLAADTRAVSARRGAKKVAHKGPVSVRSGEKYLGPGEKSFS